MLPTHEDDIIYDDNNIYKDSRSASSPGFDRQDPVDGTHSDNNSNIADASDSDNVTREGPPIREALGKCITSTKW